MFKKILEELFRCCMGFLVSFLAAYDYLYKDRPLDVCVIVGFFGLCLFLWGCWALWALKQPKGTNTSPSEWIFQKKED